MGWIPAFAGMTVGRGLAPLRGMGPRIREDKRCEGLPEGLGEAASQLGHSVGDGFLTVEDGGAGD